MNDLLAGSTTDSHRLLEIAREIAAHCPPELGAEIAVTGSVSRGVDDEYSDIEINFWLDTVPTAAQVGAWLDEIGATDRIIEVLTLSGGFVNTIARYQGVWVELGWQPTEQVDAALDRLLAAEDTNSLTLAEVITHCLPLRTEGKIAEWQQRLAIYPAPLQQKVIAEATRYWGVPLYTEANLALARRGQIFALTPRLAGHLHNVLRILFALNREWQPDFKWIAELQHRLTVKPNELVQRINQAMADPNLETSQTTVSGMSVKMNLEARLMITTALMLDTLDLVPPGIDISAARRVLAAALPFP